MQRQVIVLSVLLALVLLTSAAIDGQNYYQSIYSKGKPSFDFVPRLGRESGEDANAYVISLGDAKWLQDPESIPEVIFQRSVFSPRLGKKSAFSPRLGR